MSDGPSIPLPAGWPETCTCEDGTGSLYLGLDYQAPYYGTAIYGPRPNGSDLTLWRSAGGTPMLTISTPFVVTAWCPEGGHDDGLRARCEIGPEGPHSLHVTDPHREDP